MNYPWHSSAEIYKYIPGFSLFPRLSLQAREYLISIDPVNKTILETIQSSLFVMALDDAKPYATPENYSQVEHDTCINVTQILYSFRVWNYDFSLSFMIVDPAGINWWPHDPLGW